MNKSLSPLESPVLREYNTYEEAQRLVDQLSDAGFPVQHVRIVGHDFHSVEQVTGRLTKGRAALLGRRQWRVVRPVDRPAAQPLRGRPWRAGGAARQRADRRVLGAAFGFAAHWATGGRRDFSSVTAMVAERYTVQVDAEPTWMRPPRSPTASESGRARPSGECGPSVPARQRLRCDVVGCERGPDGDADAGAPPCLEEIPASAGGRRREQELLALPQTGEHLRVLVADGAGLERRRDRLAVLRRGRRRGARGVAPDGGRRHAQHVVHGIGHDVGQCGLAVAQPGVAPSRSTIVALYSTIPDAGSRPARSPARWPAPAGPGRRRR